jgi:hypothetical protein
MDAPGKRRGNGSGVIETWRPVAEGLDTIIRYPKRGKIVWAEVRTDDIRNGRHVCVRMASVKGRQKQDLRAAASKLVFSCWLHRLAPNDGMGNQKFRLYTVDLEDAYQQS